MSWIDLFAPDRDLLIENPHVVYVWEEEKAVSLGALISLNYVITTANYKPFG